MSYILGALKKAEKDRKRDQALDLDSWDQDDWSRPGETHPDNNIILYAVLSTLMLVLILFAWLAYELLIMPQQAVVPSSQVTVNRGGQAPVTMDVIDARTEEVVPVYVEPESTEVPLQAAEPVKEVEKPYATSIVVKTGQADQTAAPVISRSKAPQEARKIPATSTKRPALPTFSGHIYFPNNHRLSRVFSGPNSYREGDEVEGYLIERIGEGVAVLSFAGKEYRVKLAN